MESELERRIEELETKLLEQEHRLIPILQNMFQYRKKYSEDHEKRDAIFRSFLYKIFSPQAVVISGIGIFSVVGLLIAMKANYLLSLQNKKIDAQNFLLVSQSNVAQIGDLISVSEQIYDEITSENVSNSKSVELSDYSSNRVIGLSHTLKPYRRMVSTFSGDQMAAKDEGENVPQEKHEFKILNLMNGLLDYEDATGYVLDERDVSPERGQLFRLVLGSGTDASSVWRKGDFDYSLLNNIEINHIEFEGISLNRSYFRYSRMQYVTFNKSKFLGADFDDSQFLSVDFHSSYFAHATFRDTVWIRSKLPTPILLMDADFSGAEISGSLVKEEKWLERAKKYNVKGIDFSAWQLRKCIEDDCVGYFELIPKI